MICAQLSLYILAHTAKNYSLDCIGLMCTNVIGSNTNQFTVLCTWKNERNSFSRAELYNGIPIHVHYGVHECVHVLKILWIVKMCDTELNEPFDTFCSFV